MNMKWLVVTVFIVLLAILVVFLMLNTGWCYLLNDDTIEMASRIACQSQQKKIYQALKKYNEFYHKLPLNLVELVDKDFIEEKDLYYSSLVEKGIRLYRYMPENFDNQNAPIISDDINNHGNNKLRLKKLRPVIIETMGNGEIVVKEIKSKSDVQEKNKAASKSPDEIFPCWKQSWDAGKWDMLISEPNDFERNKYFEVNPHIVNGRLVSRNVVWTSCENCNSFRVIDYEGRKERFISSFENSLQKCESHKWEPTLNSRAAEPVEIDDYVCVIFDKSMYLVQMVNVVWGIEKQGISYRIAKLTDSGNFNISINLHKLKWTKGSSDGTVIIGTQKLDISPYTVYLKSGERPYAIVDYDCVYGGMPAYNEFSQTGNPRHIAIIHKKDIDANMIIDLTKFRFKTWEDGLGNLCEQNNSQ
ncbi:MAG: hypothetical protein ACYC54_09605 [Sedimentisphaerales bacterium]